MKHLVSLATILSISFFTALPLTAQRVWGTNDYTTYHISEDTTVIADRHKLYLKTTEGNLLIRDFTTELPDEYIEDFDFFDSQHWYVLVGSRYIGGRFLYKTTDGGRNWEVDTSFHEVMDFTDPYAPLNQVQIINDRIYLFLGYYNSGVLYSEDRGKTWKKWFDFAPAYFYGLYSCNNDYYLYSLETDAGGAKASLYPISRDLLNEENLDFNYPCWMPDKPQCVYAPIWVSVETLSEIHTYFDEYIQSSCTTLLATEEVAEKQPVLFPNPTVNTFRLQGIESHEIEVVLVYDIGGNKVKVFTTQRGNSYDLTDLNSGPYLIKVITNDAKIYAKMLLKI